MRDCPNCGDPLADNAVICNGCKWEPERKAKTAKAKEPSELSLRAAETRRIFEANPPSAYDLTPQQWYNVCKFFPSIAEHSKRPRERVGPDNPLDKTAKAGPLLRGFRPPRPATRRDRESDAERAAIQGEAA